MDDRSSCACDCHSRIDERQRFKLWLTVGGLSRRRAARLLGCSESTITRIMSDQGPLPKPTARLLRSAGLRIDAMSRTHREQRGLPPGYKVKPKPELDDAATRRLYRKRSFYTPTDVFRLWGS